MPLEAFVVAVARTPVGRKNGGLREWHPADLGAVAVDEAVRRSKVPPSAIDDVIVGCVGQYGAQAGNIGRSVVLSSKMLPESVPGVSVDRRCGSSLEAVMFAVNGVKSGTQHIVVAAGVEMMSLVPMGSSTADSVNNEPSRGTPWQDNKGFKAKYGPRMQQLGLEQPTNLSGGEQVAKKYKMTRQELDEVAVQSHARAAAAAKAGFFKNEIVPVAGVDKEGKPITVSADEGIRAGTTLEALSKLKVLSTNGLLTAGTASQISDGAAAVVIASAEAVKKYNLTPLARIVSMALVGCDPVVMLEGPVFAAQKVLAQAKLTIDQMDLYEVNEAFASVPLAFQKANKADLRKLNVNGSAIALGHPLGATGCRLFTSLVGEMERRKAKYGLIAICHAAGTANAMIIERVPHDSKL